MSQPVHLCRYVRGSLCPSLLWPQFPDHLVRLQGSLRIHVLEQNFQQLPELALACEALAAQDSVDLVPDSGGIHTFSDAAMEIARMVTRSCKEFEQHLYADAVRLSEGPGTRPGRKD